MEEANKRLIQVEKLASIGRMAATIAHEIRNPLTSVKLNIQRVFLTEALDEIEREHQDRPGGDRPYRTFHQGLAEFYPGLGA